ncbi:GM11734 [Drosophila sechellia]|uniref:GM11734 n=2 Tax=Drosophila sechellia TaxID=7238 RepID=B4ILE0_DROSE|nr:GM11734 [Drosophila sechellia]
MTETSNQQPGIGDFSGRHSASPARTIDSHDSTTGSMDTIVDRSVNREELHQVVTTIEQSTNTTNLAGSGGNLTNSQISMLERDENRKQQEDQEQARQDAQSHIYSSPVYDEKPPAVKLLSAALDLDAQKSQANNDDDNKPNLISHQEFKQQLEEAMASRHPNQANGTKSGANTLDSRISRKQRCPPEFIKYKEGSEGGGSGSSLSSKDRRKRKASNECCSAFPLQIVLGTLQLLLAISLVALGSLLIVREAALSLAGCGIWAGLIAAVTGSLGVVSMRKTQTAFLALSLVCIASSTLALAISGVGLSRDLNRMAEQKGEQIHLIDTNSEVSAACGLIFALFLHFVVSIVSVYRCALQICTK